MGYSDTPIGVFCEQAQIWSYRKILKFRPFDVPLSFESKTAKTSKFLSILWNFLKIENQPVFYQLLI